jgi:mannose/cellobiose epimerase-like protein (N-acyl-D-glucosamine 2-epimerase family)
MIERGDLATALSNPAEVVKQTATRYQPSLALFARSSYFITAANEFKLLVSILETQKRP